MNNDKYEATLQSHSLLALERDFPDGNGIFQQDLPLAILSKKCARSLRKKI